MRTVFALFVVSLLGAPIAADDAAADTKDAALLKERGIEVTSAGVGEYLRSLQPDPTTLKRAKDLIGQLGDASFAVRSAAMRGLLDLPVVPSEQLQSAANSRDTETSIRAKQILNHPKTAEKLAAARRQRELTSAVLRTIAARRIRGTTATLLDVAPSLDEELAELAADAAANVAQTEELPPIREALEADSPAVRTVAVRAFGAAGGSDVLAELHSISSDKDPRLRIAVARSLAEHGDGRCLPILVELLQAESMAGRVRAEQILRAATGKNFGFNPFARIAEQRKPIDRWKSWLAEQGESARLQVPLVLAPLPEDLSYGLLAHYTFDTSSNGWMADRSGHGRHAQSANSIAFVVRGKGHAIEFTGNGHHGAEGGHATLPSIDFAKLDEFSLALWVKETGLTHEEGEAYITYGVDRGVGTEDALGIAHFNGNLIFRVGEGQLAVSYKPVDRGRWVHVAMTFKDGLLRAYRDAEEIGATAARVKVQSANAALARHWWADGAGTSARFQGAMDEVRVYGRALSTEQIRFLMQQTSE